ncbi:MAG: PD-(D/E)XK nuclease family transposase, partial [Bacteroidaceae bacterium]|nr:PD-(D/E)XK nuclease family transposase [Bacteroidaceae bacterium]
DLETGEIFCDKLRQIYIELPYFTKTEAECETDFERWIYVLKNMETLDRLPFKVRKAVFDRLEQLASKANMTPEERWQYEEEWKNLSDYVNTHAYAMKTGHEAGLAEGMEKGLKEGLEKGLEKGLIEGEKKGKLEAACNLKKMGISVELISQATGLSIEEIENL